MNLKKSTIRDPLATEVIYLPTLSAMTEAILVQFISPHDTSDHEQELFESDRPMDDSEATDSGTKLPGDTDCNGDEKSARSSSPDDTGTPDRRSQDFSDPDLPMDDTASTDNWSK